MRLKMYHLIKNKKNSSFWAVGAMYTLVLMSLPLESRSQHNANTHENQRLTKPSLSQASKKVSWPRAQSPFGIEPAIEKHVSHLIDKMTLSQKIGQMIQPAISATRPDDVKRYHLGSVLNGGGMYPEGNAFSSLEDWRNLAKAYEDAALDVPAGLPAIPFLWGTDAVHGHNNVLGATLFPHNIGLGATRNPALLKQIGEITAKEMRATGLKWNFSPSIAVGHNIRWGRLYESFSEDPALVQHLSSAYIEGHQGMPGTPSFMSDEHAITTAKHFIGDGGTLLGDDQGNTIIDEQALFAQHGQVYYSAIQAGVQVIMASYSSWNNDPMHGHRYLLSNVLKSQMGFDGFVIGDWNAISKVKGCSRDNCPQAVNAGIDMLMVPFAPDWQNMIKNLTQQVNQGTVPIARINDAVRRILRVKLRMGLFKPNMTPDDAAPESIYAARAQQQPFNTEEHRAIARQAVRESLVLLKNNQETLPVKTEKNLLVVGKWATEIPLQTGGWSMTWQGTKTTNKHYPNATSIYEGLEKRMQGGTGSIQYSDDGHYSKKPDVAIIVFGESPYAEMFGDIENLQTLELSRWNKKYVNILKQLQADNIPTVSVVLTGRPRVITEEINLSDAVVIAWLPGTEGDGVAEVIMENTEGEHFEFTGKLPFSWPRDPCDTGKKRIANPLFPYGYGLSYQDKLSFNTFSEDYEKNLLGCDLDSVTIDAEEIRFNPEVWQFSFHKPSLERISVHEKTHVHGLSVTTKIKSANTQFTAKWEQSDKVGLSLHSNRIHNWLPQLANQYAITFDIKVHEMPTKKVGFMIECGQGCADPAVINAALERLPLEKWRSAHIPFRCMDKTNVDFRKVDGVFLIETAGNFSVSMKNIEITQPQKNAINLCEDAQLPFQ